MKYANDLVLLAKEEMVLQGISDKTTEVGRCYGMEVNVEKTNIMIISRQSSPVQIMTGQKQMENVVHFNYLGSFITSYA